MIKLTDIIGDQQPHHLREGLELLFQAKIKRSDVIDLSNSNHEITLTMKDALRTYKRGLMTHPSSDDQFTQESKIEFGSLLLSNKTIIIDSNVYAKWSLKTPDCKHIVIDEVNEKNKNLDTFFHICHQLKNHPSHVFIIGGGIVCDIGAFCCAFLDIPFTLVPTTLLAMIDAAIGGKCGVNFEPYGKNQVGLFASANQVYVDIDFLSTLPPREFRSGLAEAYKHYFIDPNAIAFDDIPQNAVDCNKENILKLIEIKKSIVIKDPREKSLRKTLNFGHTFGHALESLLTPSSNPFLHGESVAWGIVFAQFLSSRISKQDTNYLDNAIKDLLSLNLLTNINWILEHWDSKKLFFYIEQDKKNNQDIQVVLYGKPGELLNNQMTESIKYDEMKEYLSRFHQFLLENKQRFL